MKELREILYKVQMIEVVGNLDIKVEGLTFDSRQVKDGFAYIAQKGTKVDGHNFIDKAIDAGATTIILEDLPMIIRSKLKVSAPRKKLPWEAVSLM